MAEPVYLHLQPGQAPPQLETGPFKAVVVIDAAVSADWRERVSKWRVESGCLYTMAWGHECSLWDDSVDFANLDAFAYGDIPDDKFVMTSWHENETLSEVFWFAANAASHPDVELDEIVLVHVASRAAGADLLDAFETARSN